MANAQKHLLVDGWNAIRSDKEMARAFSTMGQDGAKKMLAARLSKIHDAFNYRVTIVYDGKGDDINVERIGLAATFSEVYTPSNMSADDFMEQMCATSKNPKSLVVASDDNLIRLTAMTFGVESLTSQQLLQWASSAAGHFSERFNLIKQDVKLKWQEASSLGSIEVKPLKERSIKKKKR